MAKAADSAAADLAVARFRHAPRLCLIEGERGGAPHTATLKSRLHQYRSGRHEMRLSIAPSSIAVVLAIFLLPALSPAYADDRTGPGVRRSVEGVWTVKTTPHNCTTGAPIPGAEFEGLFTFHRDGTMSAWLQNAFITVTRSPSQGLWQREHGRSSYSFGFIHLRYDISGFYIGKQTAAGDLTLNEGGDQFTTDSSTALFDANGLPLGGGCASAVGTRFELGS